MKGYFKIVIAILCFIQSINIYSINSSEIEKIKIKFTSNTRMYTLKNGIRVILLQNKLSPTIACYIKIGVGSANEPFDQAGTAHFLEHLLFKGTRLIGTTNFKKESPYLEEIAKLGGEIDDLKLKIMEPLVDRKARDEYSKKIAVLQKQLIKAEQNASQFVISEEDSRVYSLAGQIGYNAYTSQDVTNYQIKLPKNRLELWAYMESSRFQDPVFREYYQERDVIQEERRMRFDSNPHSRLYELFNSVAFGFSPYGKPVIGYANNIPNLKLGDTRHFYDTQYIPSRMVIAISGDIDYEASLEIIKKYFEKIPDRPEPPSPPIAFEESLGRKTAELTADSTPYLITGWSKPSIQSPDSPAYEVLSRILTDGQTSRLVKKIVIDEKLAQSIGSESAVPAEKLTTQFAFFVAPYEEKNYGKIYDLINTQLDEIKKNGVTDKEIERVKNRIFKSVIDSLNSNAGMAELMSYYELMKHDYNYLFTYLDQIQKITSADIQRIAKQTFIEKNNTTVWINNNN
ncbi:MAG: insulinase family protein [Spirochaetia bacterium]|nr:insulinase family protein [Spirochaetia bacterium]